MNQFLQNNDAISVGVYIKILIIIVVVSGILGYAYLRTQDLLQGPQVFIFSPQSGDTVDEALVVIEGKTQNIGSITLNGKEIITDEKGNIREERLLIYGYNIFEIKARDKFGKETTKTLELVYK